MGLAGQSMQLVVGWVWVCGFSGCPQGTVVHFHPLQLRTAATTCAPCGACDVRGIPQCSFFTRVSPCVPASEGPPSCSSPSSGRRLWLVALLGLCGEMGLLGSSGPFCVRQGLLPGPSLACDACRGQGRELASESLVSGISGYSKLSDLHHT